MKNLTYFERWGFSINEGGRPCIHLSWNRGIFLHIYTKFFEVVIASGIGRTKVYELILMPRNSFKI